MASSPVLTRYDITDLNNGQVQGFPVANPPGWDAISLFYAKALQKMGWNPSGQGNAPDAPQNPDNDPYPGTPNPENTWEYGESPDMYFFWGAMHWWPGHDWEYWNANAPSPQDEYWSHCTHGPAQVEKYFLPWHRMYIYYYEIAIRRQVTALGGPENWSLPYWNYSYADPSNPSQPWPRSCLPWVFCQTQLPDGTGNPLYLDETRRGLQPTWPGGQLKGQVMYLQTTTPYYSGAYGEPSWEPAGSRNGFNATLDGRPHGAVHNDTGNGDAYVSSTGWMQSTQTAGFDPIFWLHHSEIDRFWVGWNAAGGKDPDQNSDPNWLTASDDTTNGRWNFWADGNINNAIVVYPGEMLDPANLNPDKFPYSYQYHDLPTVPAPKPPARAAVAAAMRQFAVAAAPSGAGPHAAARELGSSGEAVTVGHEPVSTKVDLGGQAPQLLRAALDEPGEPSRVILRLDGIMTQSPPGNYEVYLNTTDVDRNTAGDDPHFVGLFSSFGANHRHGTDAGEHHGLSASYDITDLVAYLRAQDEWDASTAQVTFVPAVPPVEGLTPVIAPVTVGSIRILTE